MFHTALRHSTCFFLFNTFLFFFKSQQEGNNKSKPEESGKSKAELRAERRAKQEAQRALKQTTQEQKEVAKPKAEAKATVSKDTTGKDVSILTI